MLNKKLWINYQILIKLNKNQLKNKMNYQNKKNQLNKLILKKNYQVYFQSMMLIQLKLLNNKEHFKNNKINYQKNKKQ